MAMLSGCVDPWHPWSRRWTVEPPAHARPRRTPAPGALDEVRDTHYDDGAPGVGERVLHRTFGEGTVVAKEGLGEEARLLIQFPSVGRKKIVARYVRGVS